MQQFDIFWQLSQKPFLGNFKLFKMVSGKGILSVFRTPFHGCFQTLNRNAFLPFNDNIVWCKYTRVIKDLSKSGSFFLLNAEKYFGARLFYSLYAQTLRIFWNVLSLKKKKKKKKKKKSPWNVKGFFFKTSSLRIS